jgi:hypothetical protein
MNKRLTLQGDEIGFTTTGMRVENHRLRRGKDEWLLITEQLFTYHRKVQETVTKGQSRIELQRKTESSQWGYNSIGNPIPIYMLGRNRNNHHPRGYTSVGNMEGKINTFCLRGWLKHLLGEMYYRLAVDNKQRYMAKNATWILSLCAYAWFMYDECWQTDVSNINKNNEQVHKHPVLHLERESQVHRRIPNLMRARDTRKQRSLQGDEHQSFQLGTGVIAQIKSAA